MNSLICDGRSLDAGPVSQFGQARTCALLHDFTGGSGGAVFKIKWYANHAVQLLF